MLALAPDEASRAAGGRLAAAGRWSGTGAGGGAVWGMCEGGDGTRYGTVVDLDGPAFQCSCPSRKFPCKHTLGLLLRWAGDEAGEPARSGDGPAAGGKPPPWAAGWLAARRERSDRPPGGAGAGGPGARGSEADGAGAAPPARAPADPEAARRRAARRMQRIAAGATELEQRPGGSAALGPSRRPARPPGPPPAPARTTPVAGGVPGRRPPPAWWTPRRPDSPRG
ncbi:zinc finger SWIM domain protein [Streptomyces sp. 769]|nr:zinc finger SWIM domain protein [Streptomyces sp. 769]